jgi:DUF917 family protein
MRWIGPDELDRLATGATLLGAGGGGDPFLGRLVAETAIARRGAVELVSLQALPDDGLVVPTAVMGAPTVVAEKILNGQEGVRAVRHLEDCLGQRAVAVMALEAGGINALIALAIAAELGLRVVDADGMGRAWPELQMTTLHLHGLSATPMVVADEKGNVLTVTACDNHWAERLARSATGAMGGSAVIAAYPLSAAEARAAAVPGSLSLAARLGALLQDRTRPLADRLRALAAETGGRVLFHGKVVDVFRRTADGLARGTVTLLGQDGDAGHEFRIEFQNEYLLALRDGAPVAMVPDLIALLDAETLVPITTEKLGYGQRVMALGMPSASAWRSSKGLETVGPRVFGYAYDFVPVEASDA